MASWAERANWWHVYLDGVFNHAGRSFPAIRAALAGWPILSS